MRGAENFVLVLPQGVLYAFYTDGEECIVARSDARGQGDSVSDRAGIYLLAWQGHAKPQATAPKKASALARVSLRARGQSKNCERKGEQGV
jgi:hypothetical protein